MTWLEREACPLLDRWATPTLTPAGGWALAANVNDPSRILATNVLGIWVRLYLPSSRGGALYGARC
jgi:hypothetical protein